MANEELPKVNCATHLGIKRIVDNKADIDEKISIGRKAAYSLMGAGLHSGNGLKQSICAELWKSEVIPTNAVWPRNTRTESETNGKA